MRASSSLFLPTAIGASGLGVTGFAYKRGSASLTALYKDGYSRDTLWAAMGFGIAAGPRSGRDILTSLFVVYTLPILLGGSFILMACDQRRITEKNTAG